LRSSDIIASWVREGTERWNIRGIPRLLYATRNPLLGKEPRLFELYGSTRLYLNPNDYIQCMMFYNRYSREILEVFRYFAKPGDTVVDVGAHIGYFTLFLAKLVGSRGHVYSFEPDHRARSFLTKSVDGSGIDWIDVSPLALASGRGSIKFFLASGLGSSSAIKSIQQLDAKETAIQTVSLDELVEEESVVGNIRLVKIDVEGFELDAIRGMTRVLMDHRPVMVVEVNKEMLHARGESPANLFALLTSLDYRVEALLKPRRGRYKECVITTSIKNTEQKDGYYDVLCLPKELDAVQTGRYFRI
jgi:FkbM family methyltransferase